MKFSNPIYAHFFWLVPLLIVFYVWAIRRKRKALEIFAEWRLIPILTSTVNWRNQKIKAVLAILAFCFLVFALIGPRWGFHWYEVNRQGIDIIVAIDTSKSMLTEDIKPNRLERAKLAVQDLINQLEGDRIGLVAFAGNGFLQCPLTMDYNAFSIALNAVNTDLIPRGGTSISSAIKTAIAAFEGKAKKYKALILITDGEDHEGDPVKAAEEAGKQGIKIFCVGVGTREGELVPQVDELGNPVLDERGEQMHLKDRDGRFVTSRLNETTLQAITLASGVVNGYIRASATEYGLDVIYDQQIAAMEKKELESKFQKRYEERYQIPTAIALGLLCLGAFLGERRLIRTNRRLV